MKKRFFIWMAICCSAQLYAAEYSFSFYGAPVTLELPQSLLQAPSLKPGASKEELEQRIRDWNQDDLRALAENLKVSAAAMQLDDVACARLMNVCTRNLYGDNPDAMLMEWLLLRHASYDAVLGTGSKLSVYLQFAFLTEGTQFITYMGKKYTLPQGEPDPFSGKETVFVSTEEPATEGNALFFNMRQLPQLGKSRRLRKCMFTFNETVYKLYVPWMDDVVDYLNDLPVIQLGPLFYETPVNVWARKLLLDSFSLWTAGFSQRQTLDFLLTFVQQVFPYRRDRDYMKYDRHNFSEQTLAAPYADCEDKAVLFAQLVRDVMGYSSLFIYNAQLQHISVAVAWPFSGVGQTIQHQSTNYLICEPANYGYRAGESRLPEHEPGVIIPLQQNF